MQGVFFRASTARQAEQWGLRGFAKNLPDGRVEVLAMGNAAAVTQLADWLRHGPPRARVTDVAGQDVDPAAYPDLRDFRTR